MSHDDSHDKWPRPAPRLRLLTLEEASRRHEAPPADDCVIVHQHLVHDLFTRQMLRQAEGEAEGKPARLQTGGFFVPRMGNA